MKLRFKAMCLPLVCLMALSACEQSANKPSASVPAAPSSPAAPSAPDAPSAPTAPASQSSTTPAMQPSASGESSVQANASQAQSNFSQPELEQMLAPIALYPDALLSQILMASTYPTEVVAASNWLKSNPGLKGAAAVQAAQSQQWDISVKSLLPFPQVLGTMESKQDWTTNLGNAFLGQEKEVMDTVQSLRRKAMAAGYLKSDNRVKVVDQNQLISINLVSPTAVYVPYYNPTIVYGTWWAPAYAPVYWAPWPGYAVAPGYHGWAWAPVATVVTVGILYGAFNWHSRSVHYGRDVGYWRGHYHYDHYRGRTSWRHDPSHRGATPYRHTTVNQRYGHAATNKTTVVGAKPGTVTRTGAKSGTVTRTTGPTGSKVKSTTTTRTTTTKARTGATGTKTVKTKTTVRSTNVKPAATTRAAPTRVTRAAPTRVAPKATATKATPKKH